MRSVNLENIQRDVKIFLENIQNHSVSIFTFLLFNPSYYETVSLRILLSLIHFQLVLRFEFTDLLKQYRFFFLPAVKFIRIKLVCFFEIIILTLREWTSDLRPSISCFNFFVEDLISLKEDFKKSIIPLAQSGGILKCDYKLIFTPLICIRTIFCYFFILKSDS